MFYVSVRIVVNLINSLPNNSHREVYPSFTRMNIFDLIDVVGFSCFSDVGVWKFALN